MQETEIRTENDQCLELVDHQSAAQQLPVVTRGKIEASATRRPSTPNTLNLPSTICFAQLTDSANSVSSIDIMACMMCKVHLAAMAGVPGVPFAHPE